MKKIGYLIIMLIVTVAHFLVTFVVVLFLLSTLNIVNEDILHIGELKYIEITISACIFIVSAFIYVKSFGKMSLFIKKTFSNNNLR